MGPGINGQKESPIKTLGNGVNTLIYTFGECLDCTPVSRIEFPPPGSEIGGPVSNYNFLIIWGTTQFYNKIGTRY